MSRLSVWSVLTLGALLAIASAAFSAQEGSDDKASAFPEGKGREIVVSTCQECHGLENITGTRHTLDDWRDVVKEMISNGADLKEDEAEIVAQYLAKNFGPEKADQTEGK